jgi:hypothetical protein
MRRPWFILLSVALLTAGATTQGAAQGAAQGAPRFTLAEEIVIARNDALNDLLKTDPWSVRRIIDAMAAAKQQPSSAPRDRQRDVGDRRSGDGTVQIDPLRNPDLEIFQRASPEAAYDLFQILKRVGGAK